MAQQSLIYSFVARGTVILVDFTDFKGNFTSIAAQCLQKLPSSNNKVIYNCDGHTFNYLVENGFSKSCGAVDLMYWSCVVCLFFFISFASVSYLWYVLALIDVMWYVLWVFNRRTSLVLYLLFEVFSFIVFGWFRIALTLIVSKGSWVRISPKESYFKMVWVSS